MNKKDKDNSQIVHAEGQLGLGPEFGEVKTAPGEYMTVLESRTLTRSVVVFSPDGNHATAQEVARGRFDGTPPGDASPYEVEIYMDHRPQWKQKGALTVKISGASDKAIERHQELESARMEAIIAAREEAEKQLGETKDQIIEKVHKILDKNEKKVQALFPDASVGGEE